MRTCDRCGERKRRNQLQGDGVCKVCHKEIVAGLKGAKEPYQGIGFNAATQTVKYTRR